MCLLKHTQIKMDIVKQLLNIGALEFQHISIFNLLAQLVPSTMLLEVFINQFSLKRSDIMHISNNTIWIVMN